MALVVGGVLLCSTAAPVQAHRVDEYLQATTILVAQDRVHLEMRLIPGTAVVPAVLRAIDTDSNYVISAAEERAYVERVLRDLSLTIDDDRVTLWLVSWTFPGIDEMKDGRGAIRLEISGDVRALGHHRRLVFENHHLRPIAAYLVNALVPSDSAVRLAHQKRDYTQSSYQLDYVQAGVASSWAKPSRSAATWELIIAASFLGFARLLSWRRRPREH
jgi:hypothetical protein